MQGILSFPSFFVSSKIETESCRQKLFETLKMKQHVLKKQKSISQSAADA